MFDKEIKFIATNKAMLHVWPHPKPASYFIPPEYKKLKRHPSNDLKVPSLKTCIPFLDVMTAGYIIPFDQDYVVDPVEKDFTVIPANREPGQVGYHDNVQLPKEWEKFAGARAGKFHNKWLIKTPPGYSCLFTQPMNRHTENRFRLIDGIVDTDTYMTEINFPFILKKRDEQFLIKKGEAMVQVIPFKRESWKMWSGFYHEKEHNKTNSLLNSVWIDRYKNLFWNKKSFK